MCEQWSYSTWWHASLHSSIWWELLYVQCIGMCIVTFQTSWGTACSLWHAPKYLWCNSGESLFRSSSLLAVFMIAVHSHLSFSNTPQTFVHFGKDRIMWWTGLWCGRCWWAVADVVSQNMFIENFTHSWAKCGGFVLCCSHIPPLNPLSLSSAIQRTYTLTINCSSAT
jgi:hypothetical protein